jgi:cyclophilin family peptidyl-prolyl cis-trans isomerase
MHCISDAKSERARVADGSCGFVAFSPRAHGAGATPAQTRRQNRRNALATGAKLSGFALGVLGLVGCSARDRHDPPPEVHQPSADAAPRVARAVALQNARLYDPALTALLADPSAEARHAAAAALGTMDEPEATAALVSALASSDLELVRASARGLAVSFRKLAAPDCDALAIALVRLQNAQNEPALEQVARALGTCESVDAEAMLRNLLASHEDAALAGLGRLARSRKKLQTATQGALLDRALGAESTAAHTLACLEPMARVPWSADLGARVLGATLPPAVTSARIYGQLGATAQLEALAAGEDPALEARAARFEALRALAKAAKEPAFVRVLATAARKPEETPATWAESPRGALFAQVLGLAPAQVDSAGLQALLSDAAALDGPPSSRLDHIRCESATRIAKSAFDSAHMVHCAREGSLAFSLARLVSLERSPLRGGRLPHFEALLQSTHLRVREAALAVIATHPEALASTWGLAAVVRALGSAHAGEVIAALEVAEKLPATRTPDLSAAFAAAAARPWPPDAAELFEALLKAGRDRHFPATATLARSLACHAAQPVRKLAREIVQDAPACTALVGVFPPAPPGGTTIVLRTTAGALTLRLDKSVAPASAATIARLAREGFYAHVEMHRVVPGFVVQFGDPEADGYGGGGGILLHEASDNSFAPLRIGLAHAGFDTASSQLFVTTGPARHLDGDYTWLGTAEGPWQDVVQGDVVTSVQIAQE